VSIDPFDRASGLPQPIHRRARVARRAR